MAAPVGGQIFSEILPYLEVNQGNSDEVEVIEEVETPDIVGKSLSEAEKILKDVGLEISIEKETEGLDMENTFVKEQTPKSGINVKNGSKVYVEGFRDAP